jgi:hypothetical protein
MEGMPRTPIQDRSGKRTAVGEHNSNIQYQAGNSNLLKRNPQAPNWAVPQYLHLHLPVLLKNTLKLLLRWQELAESVEPVS